MPIKDTFLAELEQEAPLTRKFLERVPQDRLAWKPHEKSMTLGRLASHIAELPGWGEIILAQEEFDMSPPGGERPAGANLDKVQDIVALYDGNMEKLRERLASTSDDAFMEMWALKSGGEIIFSAPRVGVTRSSVFNHMVHHRAQLSVYLRLTDVDVPSSYGPSADETA